MAIYIRRYQGFVFYVVLIASNVHVSPMEKGLICLNKQDEVFYGNKQILKDFEVGTRMGGVVTRIFPLDSKQQINAIELRGTANVAFSQVGKDEEESVTIKTEENSIDQLEIAIRDNHILSIGYKSDDFIQSSKGILYCIALRNIHHIMCADAVNMLSLTPIKTEKLEIELQGRSKFVANGIYDIDTNLLKVILKDLSSTSLSGKAWHQDLYLYDTTNHCAQGLETHTVAMQASDASKINVSMVDLPTDDDGLDISSITGFMSGSSQLYYTGVPFTRVEQKDLSLLIHIKK